MWKAFEEYKRQIFTDRKSNAKDFDEAFMQFVITTH